MVETGIGGPPAALDEIRQLKSQVAEIALSLKNQQDLLKIRGMSLPPGTLQSVSSIQTHLAKIETSLTDEQTELGQLRALVATSAMINSSLDLDTILNGAMDEIINLTGAERGFILLKNPVTDEMEFRVARDPEHDPSTGTYQVSSTILNEVLTTRESLLSDNAFKDPRMQNSTTIAQFVLRSVMCAPLISKDTLIGAIYVDNRLRIGVFSEREMNLLKAFANQVAVAIENARLFNNVASNLAEITEIKDLIENVFASISSGVITTNAEDYVTTINMAASDILSRANQDAVGQLVFQVFPALDVNFETMLREVRDNDRRTAIEVQPLFNNTRRVLSMKLSPLKDVEKRTQGVAMVMDDLTDERERQEVLELMRGYLPPGMMDNIHSISKLALGGERRTVSCVFADVCPLASLTGQLRPGQIMEVLNVYLNRATEIIHRAGGLIDKYMGSEVMVLFNTQLNPMEDHARQAVELALQLREGLAELNISDVSSNPQKDEFYRVGIHSGVATLGNVGSSRRRNFTAIGDSINLAKRLQENATAGQLIISEDTLRALQQTQPHGLERMRVEERGTIQVKGRQQMTPIYEVFRS